MLPLDNNRLCAIMASLARRANHSERMMSWIRRQTEMSIWLIQFFSGMAHIWTFLQKSIPAEATLFETGGKYDGKTISFARRSYFEHTDTLCAACFFHIHIVPAGFIRRPISAFAGREPCSLFLIMCWARCSAGWVIPKRRCSRW